MSAQTSQQPAQTSQTAQTQPGEQPSSDQLKRWHELSQQLRVDSIRASTAAGSGHPTSSMSAADLMAVLLARYLRYDFDKPKDPDNDHLIFSKGHASPLLYAMYKAAGAITDQELLTFRQFGSRLQGHPTPAIPWVDVATGSLGQGLPIGVGIGLAGKYLDKLPYRVWVLCGDSELAEGSMWEAFQHGAYYKLHNLIAIADINRLGQRGPTMLQWDIDGYADRFRAFGWHAIEIDGHDLEQINHAYAEALQPRDCPSVIVAKTIKGAGVSFLANKEGWHGKALDPEQAKEAIRELGGERHITIQVHQPPQQPPAPRPEVQPLKLPTYKVGDQVATRAAYGDGLKAVGAARPDVVALDGEVSNSTYADRFAHAYPDRFFEMFIAEQQLVAAAIGLQVRHYVPFASSFAAFLSRAYDFIRMGAISRANIRLCGSHAGVSIGEDGPSQMALEDLAMMRAIPGSTVLYPCDPNETAQLVALIADQPGISFLRTTREKTPVLYEATDTFHIGGSKIVRQSKDDKVTVVGAGITVHEGVKAAEELDVEGVPICLIDAYSVKPLDAETIRQAVSATGGCLVVSEDHYPQGGLGEAILESFAGTTASDGLHMIHLAVRGVPVSGKPEELLDAAGISARHIADAVRELLNG